ncbi:spore germination protein GerPB [Ferviditalea candida]|uniref:Spore germination protein GerPB n=1 Tax=Ferviditalea candida TaxID=3108399 RepID=A0ABU5ZEF5_9BACL|nr:spore germination protein GerPB [Paenibacillaceae bacterium T2]
MNLIVFQSIVIHNLRVEGVSEASILQIGSSGKITTHAQSYIFEGYVPGLVPTLPPPELLTAPPVEATFPSVPLPAI